MQTRLPMWGQDFILPPAFEPAFFRGAGRCRASKNAGKTPA
jgi:hypothetical protein